MFLLDMFRHHPQAAQKGINFDTSSLTISAGISKKKKKTSCYFLTGSDGKPIDISYLKATKELGVKHLARVMDFHQALLEPTAEMQT